MYNKNRKKTLISLLAKQNGFMITEVLMTMIVIVITMVAIIPMFYAGVKTSRISKHRTVEMNIAQKEIEKFNQDKFFSVYNNIQTNSTPANFANFITGGTNIYSNFDILDINGKGEVVTSFCAGCVKEVYVTRTYSFLPGDTSSIVDDSIQLSVKVELKKLPTNSTFNDSTPVVVSAVLSRDKF